MFDKSATQLAHTYERFIIESSRSLDKLLEALSKLKKEEDEEEGEKDGKVKNIDVEIDGEKFRLVPDPECPGAWKWESNEMNPFQKQAVVDRLVSDSPESNIGDTQNLSGGAMTMTAYTESGEAMVLYHQDKEGKCLVNKFAEELDIDQIFDAEYTEISNDSQKLLPAEGNENLNEASERKTKVAASEMLASLGITEESAVIIENSDKNAAFEVKSEVEIISVRSHSVSSSLSKKTRAVIKEENLKETASEMLADLGVGNQSSVETRNPDQVAAEEILAAFGIATDPVTGKSIENPGASSPLNPKNAINKFVDDLQNATDEFVGDLQNTADEVLATLGLERKKDVSQTPGTIPPPDVSNSDVAAADEMLGSVGIEEESKRLHTSQTVALPAKQVAYLEGDEEFTAIPRNSSPKLESVQAVRVTPDEDKEYLETRIRLHNSHKKTQTNISDGNAVAPEEPTFVPANEHVYEEVANSPAVEEVSQRWARERYVDTDAAVGKTRADRKRIAIENKDIAASSVEMIKCYGEFSPENGSKMYKSDAFVVRQQGSTYSIHHRRDEEKGFTDPMMKFTIDQKGNPKFEESLPNKMMAVERQEFLMVSDLMKKEGKLPKLQDADIRDTANKLGSLAPAGTHKTLEEFKRTEVLGMLNTSLNDAKTDRLTVGEYTISRDRSPEIGQAKVQVSKADDFGNKQELIQFTLTKTETGIEKKVDKFNLSHSDINNLKHISKNAQAFDLTKLDLGKNPEPPKSPESPKHIGELQVYMHPSLQEAWKKLEQKGTDGKSGWSAAAEQGNEELREKLSKSGGKLAVGEQRELYFKILSNQSESKIELPPLNQVMQDLGQSRGAAINNEFTPTTTHQTVERSVEQTTATNATTQHRVPPPRKKQRSTNDEMSL